MVERRYSWTQPQCARCFEEQNPGCIPHVLVLSETEQCVTCGVWNQNGIYIRIDPATAPFPTRLKDA